jgi:hypothetical protein
MKGDFNSPALKNWKIKLDEQPTRICLRYIYGVQYFVAPPPNHVNQQGVNL